MLRPVVSHCALGVSAAGLELLECEGEGPERLVPCELQVAACRPGWAAQECAGRGAGPRQAMEQGSHGGRELLDRMFAVDGASLSLSLSLSMESSGASPNWS
jgi:hypothetical protein